MAAKGFAQKEQLYVKVLPHQVFDLAVSQVLITETSSPANKLEKTLTVMCYP